MPGLVEELKSRIRGLVPSIQDLSATYEAGEPPAAAPAAAAAVDKHTALAIVPAVEGGIAPVAVSILPMRGIGMFIGEGRVGFVDGAERERVNGFETMRCKLFLQLVVADQAVHIVGRPVGLEKHNPCLFARAAGHCRDNYGSGVLLPAGGGKRLFRRPSAVDANDADNQVAEPLHIPAEDGKQVGAEFFRGDGLLRGLRFEFFAVFPQRGPQNIRCLVNLPVRSSRHFPALLMGT